MNRMSVLAASLFTVLTLPVAPAFAAAPNAHDNSLYLINGYVHGVRVMWTEHDQAVQDRLFAALQHRLYPSLYPASTSASNTTSPLSIGGAPPPNYDATIGTGDYLASDYLQDTSEATSGKDGYLILESPTADTCGPIAAHNLLTNWGSALVVDQLEPLVGYVAGSGTPWSSAYWTALNGQESSYTYNGYWEGETNTQTAWQNGWEVVAGTVGLNYHPTAMSEQGYLPGFNHYINGHWWTAFGYAGYSSTTQNPSTESLHYFDSSEEHSGEYWFQEYLSTFINNDDIGGVVG